MRRNVLSCTVLFTLASTAGADVVVQLSATPSFDAALPAGSYHPVEWVRLDVSLAQTPGGALRLLRVIQLDFGQTDDLIEFYYWCERGDDCPPGPSFQFDVQGFPQGGTFYSIFPALPRPAMAFGGMVANATRQFNLRADGSPVYLGSVDVTLPHTPGAYTLDAVTPADPADSNLGGLVSYGFGVVPGDDIVELRPGSGLSGGQYTFVVVPEPATLAMLGPGMLFAVHRGKGAISRGIRARRAGARGPEPAWRERQRHRWSSGFSGP
ncbi:MAG: hypothetical protein HY763_00055 [Planctomycetes bacterium]|nr:hypothetical protein [Planctomycetota bacterium]